MTQTENAVILREPERPKNLPKKVAWQERVNSIDLTPEGFYAPTICSLSG